MPALGFAALNRWYDAAITLSMREPQWRPLLVDLVTSEKPSRVLDVGCGTGTLALGLADSLGAGVVTGVDLDPAILELARAKPGAGRVAAGWRGRLARRPRCPPTTPRSTWSPAPSCCTTCR